MKNRKINVIGVGYIGSVISLYLAKRDYEVTGIDKLDDLLDKKEWFNRYTDIENKIEENVLGQIEVSTQYEDVKTGVSVVCVDTPSGHESADLTNVKSALTDLAKQIEPDHTIILRSTLPPRTSKDTLIPLIEEESGLEYDEEFNFCYAPEFIRGGTGLEDLENPSKTVMSGNNEAIEVFKQIFPVSENSYETSMEVAEAVKCFDNVFHGLKISLANESGRLGRELGFNPNKVMEIISSDERLNASAMYLEPGNSYGGPCLEKDIKILESEAKSSNTDTPVLSSINESNEEHNSWLVEQVEKKNPETVGLIGATYKKDFNSLVNSPCLEMASQLEERGFKVIVYEPEVDIDGFIQDDMNSIRSETDIWIIFNLTDEVKRAKNDFKGDIIDLSDFSF